jgi:hypothetical protein
LRSPVIFGEETEYGKPKAFYGVVALISKMTAPEQDFNGALRVRVMVVGVPKFRAVCLEPCLSVALAARSSEPQMDLRTPI